MNEVWKKATLLSFGSKRKGAMNGFISWHLWTKTNIDNTCVKKYIKIQNNSLVKRPQKTTFFDNLWDEFCKLNIERFYKLNTSQTFDSHLLMKDDILDLIKCIVNARINKSNNESIKHEKSVAKIHSNINEELGLTKFYARNDAFNHYCSSNLKFGNPYF